MKSRIYIIQIMDAKSPGQWENVESTMLWYKAMDIMRALADRAMVGDSLRILAHHFSVTADNGSDYLSDTETVGFFKRTSDTTDYKEEDYE